MMADKLISIDEFFSEAYGMSVEPRLIVRQVEAGRMIENYTQAIVKIKELEALLTWEKKKHHIRL